MAVQGFEPRNVRPVQAWEDEDDGEMNGDVVDDESEGEESDGGESDEGSGFEDDDAEMEGDLDGAASSQGDGDDVPDISNVSFGALKQAQDSLSRKRKRDSDTNADQQEKLDALRARLRQIKASKNDEGDSRARKSSTKREQSARLLKVHVDTATGDDDESDSDSAPSEIGGTKSRTSKHAPSSQSTKYQVTRRRNVVDVPKRVSRDPRFDAITKSSANPGNNRKAYGFLRDYQQAEIAELKSALKQAKTEEDRVTLRRKLVSMENRIKSEDAKEREQSIRRQHRKEEREKVQQGKQPYYLKDKEVKERALVEKFNSMKSKDRQKLLEKRRLKESQREKKRMPEARRVE